MTGPIQSRKVAHESIGSGTPIMQLMWAIIFQRQARRIIRWADSLMTVPIVTDQFRQLGHSEGSRPNLPVILTYDIVSGTLAWGLPWELLHPILL